MDTNGIQVIIAANNEKLKTAMKEAEAQVQASATAMKGHIEGMKGSFDGLQGMFGKIGPAMAAVTAILAGGAAFHSAVDDTVAFAGASNKLAKQLGITAGEASVMSMALGDIGSSGEAYGESLMHLDKQLKGNEAGLQEYGLKTRDANGHLKSGKDLMQDAIGVMSRYKSGTDQTQVAMALFGRGAEDALKFLRLNAKGMAEAQEKAESLGLVLSQKSVDDAKKYKAALNDVGDVMDGIKNAIGSAVLPGLTNLANAFADIGPTAVGVLREAMTTYLMVQDTVKESFLALWDVIVQVVKPIRDLIKAVFGADGTGPDALGFFRNALALVQVVLIGFRVGVQESFAIIGGVISNVVTKLQGFADVAIAVFQSISQGSLTPLKDAFKRSTKAVEDDLQNSMNKMVNIATKGREDMQKALMGESRVEGPAAGAPKTGDGTKTVGNKAGKDGPDKASQIAALHLAQVKATDANELALLKEKISMEQLILEDGYGRHLTSLESYYSSKLKLSQEDTQKQIELKKKDIAENDSREPKTEVDKEKKILENIKLQGQLDLIEKQGADQIVAINLKKNADLEALNLKRLSNTIDLNKESQLTELDIQRTSNSQLLALNAINNEQSLKLTLDLAQKERDIQIKALEEKKKLMGEDTAGIEAVDQQIALLKLSSSKTIAGINKDLVLEQKKDNIALYTDTENELANFIGKVAESPKTIQDAFSQMLKAIAADIIKLNATKISQNIMGAITGGGGASGGGFDLGGMFSSGMSSIGGLLGLASGTNYVPRDMPVNIHQGEAVIPKQFNNPESFAKMGSGGNKGPMNVTLNANFSTAPDKRTLSQMAATSAAALNNTRTRGNI